MCRSLLTLVLLSFLASAPCHAQQSLVGTYKLVSFAVEIDGQSQIEPMGKSPRGYLILTPTRLISIVTAEKRKFDTSIEEKAALWESLLAYTGLYRLDGSKIVISVDASWNESWNGTQVTRNWQMDANRLSITSMKAPYSVDPSRMVVGRVVFEKID